MLSKLIITTLCESVSFSTIPTKGNWFILRKSFVIDHRNFRSIEAINHVFGKLSSPSDQLKTFGQ